MPFQFFLHRMVNAVSIDFKGTNFYILFAITLGGDVSCDL